MGNVQRLFEPLKCWELERLPLRPDGYSLDLDSTVFERYGEQEGSLKGHNPRKHGRPSHHPLLAVLAEAHFVLHGWLRSGNCGTSRGVVEFLEEALALWQQRQKVRLVRADSGFFDDKLLTFLEQRCLSYIVVTRLTQWVKREAQRIQQWTAVDADYAVGEFNSVCTTGRQPGVSSSSASALARSAAASVESCSTCQGTPSAFS
jgi:hypothetical protein